MTEAEWLGCTDPTPMLAGHPMEMLYGKSILSRQCLDRRIESKEIMVKEVGTWEQDRNEAARESTGGSLQPTPGLSSSDFIPHSRHDRALGASLFSVGRLLS